MVNLKNVSARLITFYIDPPVEGKEAHIPTVIKPGDSVSITADQYALLLKSAGSKALVEDEQHFRVTETKETVEEYVSPKKK